MTASRIGHEFVTDACFGRKFNTASRTDEFASNVKNQWLISSEFEGDVRQQKFYQAWMCVIKQVGRRPHRLCLNWKEYMPYKPYWKSEFQNCLTSVAGKGNLLRWEEISDSLSTDKNRVWEYVYRFRLRNPAVSIVIYSSVYKETDRSRDINSDAVRIVFEWCTKNGDLYSKVAKKYRVDSLFENLGKELISVSGDCFDLNKYTWVPLRETDV